MWRWWSCEEVVVSGQQAQPPARRGRGRLLYIYEREAERERGQRVRDESGEERSRESVLWRERLYTGRVVQRKVNGARA